MKNDIRESIGKTLRIKGSSLKGILVKIKQDSAVLEVEGKILTINIEKLELIKEKRETAILTKNKSKKNTIYSKPYSIDLHGMTKNDAKEKLLDALNFCLLNNIEQLEIIHGHGEGVLKNFVSQFLNESSLVKKYKVLEHNTGTTVAYL